MIEFKATNYNISLEKGKTELIKDIIAFANSLQNDKGYIILGVKNLTSKNKLLGINDLHLDDATLQEIVNSKLNRKIKFEYLEFEFKRKVFAVIQIESDGKPFYLIKDYKNLKKESVYIRRGTATFTATPDEVYLMGQLKNHIHKDMIKVYFDIPNLDIPEPKIMSVKSNKIRSRNLDLMKSAKDRLEKDLSNIFYTTFGNTGIKIIIENRSHISLTNNYFTITIPTDGRKIQFHLPEYSKSAAKKNQGVIDFNSQHFTLQHKVSIIQPGVKINLPEFFARTNYSYNLNLDVMQFCDQLQNPIRCQLLLKTNPRKTKTADNSV